MKIMNEGERHRYETCQAHGDHPAGSPCWVSRNTDQRLILEFDDGVQVELDPKYYARGIEEPGLSGMDAEVLKEIDAAIFLAM